MPLKRYLDKPAFSLHADGFGDLLRTTDGDFAAIAGEISGGSGGSRDTGVRVAVSLTAPVVSDQAIAVVVPI